MAAAYACASMCHPSHGLTLANTWAVTAQQVMCIWQCSPATCLLLALTPLILALQLWMTESFCSQYRTSCSLALFDYKFYGKGVQVVFTPSGTVNVTLQ